MKILFSLLALFTSVSAFAQIVDGGGVYTDVSTAATGAVDVVNNGDGTCDLVDVDGIVLTTTPFFCDEDTDITLVDVDLAGTVLTVTVEEDAVQYSDSFDIASIDDDIDDVAFTLTGTLLEITVSEGATSVTTSIDLVSLLDDTDVSSVVTTLTGTVLETEVVEDGVVYSDTEDLTSLLDDTDISAVNTSLTGTVLTTEVVEDGVTYSDTEDLAAIDTDISGVNTSLSGTVLTTEVVEDGTTYSDTEDLAALLDDTDVSAVNTTLAGTVLTTEVVEDGTTYSDTEDLAAIDTDISNVNTTLSGTVLTTEVIEDGVTYSDTEDLASIDTDISAVGVTVTGNTLEVTVTEDGVSQSGTAILPGATPGTAVPIADNEVDTAIRTGQVGTSTLFARQDHNHPIRRQNAVAECPDINTFTTSQSAGSVWDVKTNYEDYSTEEYVECLYRIRLQAAANTGWNSILIPTKAGFQQPIISIEGTYRYSGEWRTGTALTGVAAPYMGNEATHWSSTNRIYVGPVSRTEATALYMMFRVKYIRS